MKSWEEKYEDVKAELDNTLPALRAQLDANTLLTDIAANYKLQSEHFEERAEDAEAECERLIEDNTDLRGQIQDLGGVA